MRFTILIPLSLLLLPHSILSKKMLFFLGVTTYSHRISMWPLVSDLADKGHDITFMSAHQPKKPCIHPKVKEIVPPALTEYNKKMSPPGGLLSLRLNGIGKTGTQFRWDVYPETVVQAFEILVRDPQFVTWFESESFDLVIMDALYCDLALGLAYKWRAPVIIFSTTSPYTWMNDGVGATPQEPWIPDMKYSPGFDTDVDLEGGWNFQQRWLNVLMPVYWDLLRKWNYFPKIENLLKKNLKGFEKMPSLDQLEKNTSLVLTNTHFSEEYSRSSPANLISVGGLHCTQSKELKNDANVREVELEKFMNASGSAGFIYISFGSAAQVSVIKENIKKIFFNAMRKAPVKFVLKWEGPIPDDMPQNVFPSEWLPQQKVLSHPNAKGFVCHGGLLSIHEAVVAGVPLIFLPIFAEQDFHANRFHREGRGIKLEWTTLTQEDLDGAIHKILHDTRYKENMMKTSKLFLDRPQSPLELAVWWTEYILRHGHVESLKPFGTKQFWWERRALDVWLPLLTLFLILSFIFVKTIFFISSKLCRRFLKKLDKNKKNN